MLKKCRRKLEQQTEAKQEWPCPVREIKNLMVMVKGHTWEAACQRRTTMGNRWSKFIVRSKATEPQRGRGILITLQLRAPGSRRQAPEQLFLFFVHGGKSAQWEKLIEVSVKMGLQKIIKNYI